MSEFADQEQKFFELVKERIPRLAGDVVGSEVTLKEFKTSEDRPDLGGAYVAVLSADGAEGLEIYLVFDVPSAIVFSGLLVMMQEKVIRERIIRAEMDEDDLDAMGECVNQLTSRINESFSEAFGSDHHFVFAGGGAEIPEGLNKHLKGRIVSARGKIDVGGLHTGTFRVLVPDQTITGRAPDEAGASGLELSAEEAEAIRLATLEGMEDLSDMVVLLPIDRERGSWEKTLESAGLGYHVVRDIHEARRLCATGEGGIVLIDADASPWGGLPALARLLAWKDVDAPVIVAASRPTRTHLVACLASGASTYLVKPVPPEQLRARVQDIFETWRGGQ